jgi:hypothetical protein
MQRIKGLGQSLKVERDNWSACTTALQREVLGLWANSNGPLISVSYPVRNSQLIYLYRACGTARAVNQEVS